MSKETQNKSGEMSNQDFTQTGEVLVQLQGSDWPAELFLPSADALAWDCPLPGTNRAKYIEHLGVFCYCQVEVTGRSVRRFRGGVYGLKARVRYTGADLLPEDRGWVDAVLLQPANGETV